MDVPTCSASPDRKKKTSASKCFPPGEWLSQNRLVIYSNGHLVRPAKGRLLVRRMIQWGASLPRDTAGANVRVEIGVHLEPADDRLRRGPIHPDHCQLLMVASKVSAVKQRLLCPGVGVRPRGIGFRKSILLARDSTAVVGRSEGLVTHAILHVIIVPAAARLGNEVELMARPCVMVGRQSAIERSRVEVDGLPGADGDAPGARLKGRLWCAAVSLHVVSLVLGAGIDDCDDRVVRRPI